MIAKFKKLVEEFDGTSLPIAVADIAFKFPEGVKFPNLCVKHDRYGLINPMEGRTVATISEVQLALYLGAEITYYDAFVVQTIDQYIFRDHLKGLIDKRNQAKKEGNELLQQLYKLYANTLYGKVAQGINPKKSFDIRSGGTKVIGKSSVTQAYFAALITGTLRAALSSLLVAVDELNKDGHDYLVISVTTDGMLYRVTSKSGIKFKDVLKEEYQDNVLGSLETGGDIFKAFKDVDPILYNKLQEFPALRLLQHSRKEWGYDEYIEIKHAVNEVLNIKTRGQIGAYRG